MLFVWQPKLMNRGLTLESFAIIGVATSGLVYVPIPAYEIDQQPNSKLG
jgi:hypothetical protein